MEFQIHAFLYCWYLPEFSLWNLSVEFLCWSGINISRIFIKARRLGSIGNIVSGCCKKFCGSVGLFFSFHRFCLILIDLFRGLLLCYTACLGCFLCLQFFCGLLLDLRPVVQVCSQDNLRQTCFRTTHLPILKLTFCSQPTFA